MSDGFLDREFIIRKLIFKRVALASRIHDHVVISRYSGGKTQFPPLKDDDRLLLSIMPPRRTWVTLYQRERLRTIPDSTNEGNREIQIPTSTAARNVRRIQLTIDRDRNKYEKPKYFIKLEAFLDELEKRVTDASFSVDEPDIIPEIKDKSKRPGERKLRPISLFRLEDALIFQQANAKLTKRFDRLFQSCSFAFRSKNTETGKVPNHHDCIDEITNYQKLHQHEEIYVAECDLMKFFDTIDHLVVKREFYIAITSAGAELPHEEVAILERIFLAYLKCYDFRKVVLPKMKDEKYLEEYRLTKGDVFEWIDSKYIEKMYRTSNPVQGIGVPQGGALSGLIANLVLNRADKLIARLKDSDLLYIRYCDDMIMMHTDKKRLEDAFDLYQLIIGQQHLFRHEPKDVGKYSKTFYDTKSKNPYRWGSVEQGFVPWVSFVGYQVGYKGEIRVRKRSIEKEINKQNKIISHAEYILREGTVPVATKLIASSIQQRLIGMSVGRIAIYHPVSDNEQCWTFGFQKLTPNIFSFGQMKQLDRNRRKALRRLYRTLANMQGIQENTDEGEETRSLRTKKQPILYFGKPYSYYGWLELKQKEIEERLR